MCGLSHVLWVRMAAITIIITSILFFCPLLFVASQSICLLLLQIQYTSGQPDSGRPTDVMSESPYANSIEENDDMDQSVLPPVPPPHPGQKDQVLKRRFSSHREKASHYNNGGKSSGAFERQAASGGASYGTSSLPFLQSYQHSPEVQSAIESIFYIADHIKKEDDDNNVSNICNPPPHTSHLPPDLIEPCMRHAYMQSSSPDTHSN